MAAMAESESGWSQEFENPIWSSNRADRDQDTWANFTVFYYNKTKLKLRINKICIICLNSMQTNYTH